VPLRELLLNQVRQHLRVGLRAELVPACEQLLLEFEVVFDDAVMHDGDALLLVGMGVRVRVVGDAVRCPARVRDCQPVRLHAVEHLAQVLDFACAFHHL
jgi:hypothetical protein